MRVRRIGFNDTIPADEFPFRMGRTTLTQDNFPVHSHDFTELVILLGGRGIHLVEGDEFPVGAGDVYIFQGRSAHGFRKAGGLSMMNLMYRPEQMGLPMEELRRLAGYNALFTLEPQYRRRHRFRSRLHLSSRDHTRVEALLDRMQEEYDHDAPGRIPMLRGLFTELLVLLSRCYEETDTRDARALLRLGGVIGRIESNPADDTPLDALAAEAHMSANTFLRVFREATGRSPVAYRNERRLAWAAEMLRGSDASVTEVALACGFGDGNYLSRRFRESTGLTPSAYRRRYRTRGSK